MYSCGERGRVLDELKYPRGERVRVKYYDGKHELLFILTTKEQSKDLYFLYELKDGEFKKLGKAKSPSMLEEKYGIRNKMGVTDE